MCVLGYAETGEVPVYGTHSILPKEHGAKFFALPIVRHLTREVGAIATWDSSIHDSVCLNTVTSGTNFFKSNLVPPLSLSPKNLLKIGVKKGDLIFLIKVALESSVFIVSRPLSVSDKERPYLIVKAVVRLSDPAAMDLVLRKRICFNVYKRHSITDKIRRRMGHTSSLTSLALQYEIVSNIPKVVNEQQIGCQLSHILQSSSFWGHSKLDDVEL